MSFPSAIRSLLLLLAASLAAAQPNTLEQQFQQASAALERGNADQAIALLVPLNQQHPGIFALRETLGLAYVQSHNPQAALPLLASAAKLDPRSLAAQVNLGATLYTLGRLDEARLAFERAVHLDPHAAVALLSLGRIHMDQHHPALAVAPLAAALALDTANHDLALDLARAQIDADQTSAASVTLDRLPADDAGVHLLRAEIEERAAHYDRAVQHYIRAVELDPSEPNVFALGVEFLRHWTFEAAIREFEPAARKFPESPRIQLALGAAYFADADYARALPIFSQLLQHDPSSALNAELLGMACAGVLQGQPVLCRPLVDYADVHPADSRIRVFAATALLGENATAADQAHAARLLDQVIEHDPSFADAWLARAELRQSLNQWSASIGDLEKAIAINPDLARAHYRLALAYWRAGRKDDGKQQIELQRAAAARQQVQLNQRLQQITRFNVDVH